MSSLEMKKLYLRHCTLYFIILSARLSVCTLCPRRSYPIYIGSCYIRRVTTSWAYSILYLSVLLSIYFQFVVFKYIHVCVSVLNCHSNSLLCTGCPCLNKVQQKNNPCRVPCRRLGEICWVPVSPHNSPSSGHVTEKTIR